MERHSFHIVKLLHHHHRKNLSQKYGISNTRYPNFSSLLTFLECACNNHCVKSVQIRSLFWSVFSRIRTEYGEIQSIQSKCGKIRTRITPKYEYFLPSVSRLLDFKDISMLEKFSITFRTGS